jgi:hypothetical protein
MTTKTIETCAGLVAGEDQPIDVAPAVADESAVAASVAQALDPQLVDRLAARARAQGVSLLGRDGLLQQLTKRFLEATLEAEMDEHLGYDSGLELLDELTECAIVGLKGGVARYAG